MADDDIYEDEVPQQVVLEMFEGSPVVGYVMSLTNAGDGLSDSMKIAPIKPKRGTRVTILMEAVVDHVAFPVAKGQKPEDPNAHLLRKMVLKADAAKILNAGEIAAVDQLLADHREQVEELREQEREARTGQPRLTSVPDDA